MAEFVPGRRKLLLSGTAWIGGLAALAVARPARAFEVQQLKPKSPLALEMANRCKVAADHADLAAKLQAQLAADPSLASLSATCPLCGCPVVVTR